ncbi:MAG: lipase [Leptospiraceae bacterium]|nr:lipase [Leptospiraceae bacterium]MCP5499130.1 lipase [Leptospiraceae bacterium]
MTSSLMIAFLAFFLSASSVSAGSLSGMCIVLVHGILGFDDTNGLANGLVKYWGGMDNYLRNQGAKVATPGSSAMASLETRASQVKTYLNTWMPANGCTKVHLMGHSQGGLVSRYLVTKLSYASKVATVTTIDSVHKGAPVADFTLAVIPGWLEPFANVVLSTFAKLIYRDGRPQDAIAMGKSLTVATLKTFNSNTPNVSGVKYFSYGASMAWADPIQHPIMALTYPATWAGGLFYGLGSANDGIVPLESQKWGTWKGTPSSYWYATGLDHLQVTNFEWSGQGYFDVQGQYLTMSLNAKNN